MAEYSNAMSPTDDNETDSAVHHATRTNAAYAQAVAGSIEGLYSGFHAAATILRIAKHLGELDATVLSLEHQDALDGFFQRLNEVELDLATRHQGSLQSSHALDPNRPFVVAVEGIDGTGKSTLVQSLQQAFEDGCIMTTPTAAMANVRPVFDKRGGAVARAFYMVSNYFLQADIHLLGKKQQREAGHADQPRSPRPVVVVDRWYSSTCAYSVAYKNTQGGPEAIDALSEDVFQWPADLFPPDLQLLLCVDHAVRQDRVRNRGLTTRFNPWDDRLDKDENLGRRIVRALERIRGPRECQKLDANQTKVEVFRDAMEIVEQRVRRHFAPWEYYAREPIEYFQHSSVQLGLSASQTGRRHNHELWCMQLALHTSEERAPSMRTVGIHAVTSAGILFFCRGHPGGGCGGKDRCLASVISCVGSYPNEQQWRSEGILCRVTLEECKVLGFTPPDSLVTQMKVSKESELAATATGTDTATKPRQSAPVPLDYSAIVARTRKSLSSSISQEELKSLVCATVFVPLRMELLMGGPGSPQGPRRFEWCRKSVEGGTDKSDDDGKSWNKVAPILPFTIPDSIPTPAISFHMMPVTLVLTGTHCAGKATIGSKLAKIFSWIFDEELGDIMRDPERTIAGGHRIGDGSGDQNASTWDDRVHAEEIKRDEARKGSSRVVETWHVGNLLWALFRMKQTAECNNETRDELIGKSRRDIAKEQLHSSVLLVHLSIAAEDAVRRRAEPSNADRLPMSNAVEECHEMHQCQEKECISLLQNELQDATLPTLVIDNSEDGELAIEKVIQQIVIFVHNNMRRRMR